MKVRPMLIAMLLLITQHSSAQVESNHLKFVEVYQQLGFVDKSELAKSMEILKGALLDKEIKWTLTLKSVFTSGSPNFVEAFKIIDETTKYSVIKCDVADEDKLKWKKIKWGEKTEFTGKIINVIKINMPDDEGRLNPFVYIEVSGCTPSVR